ncbi:hypothetical protein F5X96DRAFT_687967 [Biscogniauxia mediterranea]|nr:hypothetical protein F5X96DRAFT_687967 [Biscogniauxia mediterranea]
MTDSESSISAAPVAFGAESPAGAASKKFAFKCPLNINPDPEFVVLDPDGDLYLVVGEPRCILHIRYKESGSNNKSPQANRTANHTHQNPVTFLVCSKALSRASPVWKRLLYGGLPESKPADGTKWKVFLPKDRPEPMATILNIIHSQFRDIPSGNKVTLGVFYQIVLVAEKYDVMHVLQPWCDRWVIATGLLTTNPDRFSMEDFNQALHISWAIEKTKNCAQMVMLLVKNSRVDANGRLVNTRPGSKSERYVLDESIVKIPNINDLIREARTYTIKPLFQLLREFQQNPLLVSTILLGECTDEKCITETVGSLVISIINNGLWPVPDLSDYRDSLESLETKISSHSKHRRCEADLKQRLTELLDVDGARRNLADSLKCEKSGRMKMSSSINEGDKGGIKKNIFESKG